MYFQNIHEYLIKSSHNIIELFLAFEIQSKWYKGFIYGVFCERNLKVLDIIGLHLITLYEFQRKCQNFDFSIYNSATG